MRAAVDRFGYSTLDELEDPHSEEGLRHGQVRLIRGQGPPLRQDHQKANLSGSQSGPLPKRRGTVVDST